jgi:hypothetical protein
LIFLDVVTPYILLKLTENGFIDKTKSVAISIFVFLTGFAITELALAWQGAGDFSIVAVHSIFRVVVYRIHAHFPFHAWFSSQFAT